MLDLVKAQAAGPVLLEGGSPEASVLVSLWVDL